MNWYLASLLLFACVALQSSSAKKVVCYYTNWAQYRPVPMNYFPENIDFSKCTHIIFAFAFLNQANDGLRTLEWNDDKMYIRMNKLKNDKAKVLLAVGGWTMGVKGMHEMVASSAKTDSFVTTSAAFLRKWNFDGLDLDFEFPADRGSPASDKAAFASFAKKLRAGYDAEAKSSGKPKLIISAAVGVGRSKVDNGYDMKMLCGSLDFINMMTYDLHGKWDGKTGHNSPLYADKSDTGASKYLNIDSSVMYWADAGCPKEKLIVGLAMYGRSFTLASASTNGLGATTTGGGTPGTYTREDGYLAYYEVCDMIKAGGKKHMIEDQKVPYVVSGNQWVGYDDKDSINKKAKYILDKGFGGAMIWDLDVDDFNGKHCDQGKYPLLSEINKVFSGTTEEKKPTTETATEAPKVSEAPKTTESGKATEATEAPKTTESPKEPEEKATTKAPSGDNPCDGKKNGAYAEGPSENEFIQCSWGKPITLKCSPGLKWHQSNLSCGY